MTDRKPIKKSVRFEVFKRDGFICQYCGAHPPAVILHVDHIHPVAEGGTDDFDNLITACEACNLGKGARSLTTAPLTVSEKAERLKEREDQLAAYEEIQRAKRSRLDAEIDKILLLYNDRTGWYFNEKFVKSVEMFLNNLGLFATEEAMQIAIERFDFDRPYDKDGKLTIYSHDDAESTLKYFCGICWRKIREGQHQ
jgi:hypothetical protein